MVLVRKSSMDVPDRLAGRPDGRGVNVIIGDGESGWKRV